MEQKKQQEEAAKEMARLRTRCETLSDENKAWRFSKRDMEVRPCAYCHPANLSPPPPLLLPLLRRQRPYRACGWCP